MISDGLSGLSNVVSKELPKTRLQMGIVHKKYNVLLKVRTSYKRAVVDDLKKFFKLEKDKYTVKKAKSQL